MIKMYLGDNLDIMRGFKDNTFGSVVCDPPAGIKFKGAEWDRNYGGRNQWIDHMAVRFAEMLRVTKPGGWGIVWAMPRTSHWTATALENAGWEVRDKIVHIQSQGFPKSVNLAKSIDKQLGAKRGKVRIDASKVGNFKNRADSRPWIEKAIERGYHELDDNNPVTDEAKKWVGWGTGIKPSVEDYILIRKPFSFSSVLTIDNLMEIVQYQMSDVKLVKMTSTLNLQESSVVMSDFVQWTANALMSKLSVELSDMMSMSRLLETEKTSLNIVMLWSNILEELCKKTNKYTTLIEIVLITELKTLNLLVSLIMQESIPDQSILVNGQMQPVTIVEKLLNEVKKKLENILILIAPNNVISQAIYQQGLAVKTMGEKETNGEDLSNTVMEDWWLIRKPLDTGATLAQNVLAHGVGAINIDATRVDAQGRNLARNNAPGDNGWKNSSGGPNMAQVRANKGLDPLGAWPSQLIHDGSEEVTNLLPGRSASFFYTAKANKAERNWGLDDFYWVADKARPSGFRRVQKEEYLAAPKRLRAEGNIHPTVKPLALMEYLCKMITPPGETILDPFAGSGTTLLAANRLGFDAIGIEQDYDSYQIAVAHSGAVDMDAQIRLEAIKEAIKNAAN